MLLFSRMRFPYAFSAVLTIALITLLPAGSRAQNPFQPLGNSFAIGLETGYDVAPGPTAGSQRFYASFMNESPGGTLDVLSIDPSSGNTVVMRSPVAGEFGAWGMTV